MRLAELVARLGERGTHKGFWSGNMRERGHLEGLWVDGRIRLKEIFEK
jgi:hypothetical protein